MNKLILTGVPVLLDTSIAATTLSATNDERELKEIKHPQ